ncbi:hypothetical protein C0992_012117, partial [Termitomyces sp. T32_za158]
MDVAPSNDQITTIIAPPGAAIQAAADTLIDLIVSEREAAEKASHQHYLQLEQRFATYRENANAAIATERGRFSDIRNKLLATQALL